MGFAQRRRLILPQRQVNVPQPPPSLDLGDPFLIAPIAGATGGVDPIIATTNVAVPAGGGFWVLAAAFGTADTLSSISDDSGNGYTYNTQTVQGSGSANRKVYTSWVDAPAGLAINTQITCDWSAGAAGRLVRVVGFSGKPLLEAHNGAGGNNTSPALNIPGSGTVAHANALELVAFIHGNGTVGISGGNDADFNVLGGDERNSSGSGSSTGYARIRWRRATTNAQVNFAETLTGTAEWAVAADILYGV